jgi:hypothetical protein
MAERGEAKCAERSFVSKSRAFLDLDSRSAFWRRIIRGAEFSSLISIWKMAERSEARSMIVKFGDLLLILWNIFHFEKGLIKQLNVDLNGKI